MKNKAKLSTTKLLVAAGLSLATLSTSVIADELPHVAWADDLIQHITPENNEYASNPSYIHWAGVNGATTYDNRTQCSTFLTNLLKQAYNLTSDDFKTWLNSTSPSAAQYHDAIVAQNGFSYTQNVQNISVGDVIAIKYPSGSSSTGHVMLVRHEPEAIAAMEPIIPGTVQYTVEVYDSSQSGHGALDTRKQTDGSWDTGVGAGSFRLYVNETNHEIVGYTWSTYSNSTYYTQAERHLVIGTLTQ